MAICEYLFFSWDSTPALFESTLSQRLRSSRAKLVSLRNDSIAENIKKISSSHTAGVILSISQQAVQQQTFSQVVASCLAVLSKRSDFRVFVNLKDIDLNYLPSSATRRSRAVGDILDSVQLDSHASFGPTSEELIESVTGHARRFSKLRAAFQFEVIKQSLMSFSVPLNIVTAIFAVSAVGAFFFIGENIAESSWISWYLALIGVALWGTIVALLSCRQLLLGGYHLLLLALLSPIHVVLSLPSLKIINDWGYLLAGLLFGFLVDISRRSWAKMKLRIGSFTLVEHVLDKSLASKAGRRHWIQLLNAPFLPQRQFVFISYSRSSGWGRNASKDFYEELKRRRIPSFLDISDLQLGSSWRHRLQQALGQASILVSFQDRITATRTWPIAELSAALKGQNYCGLPLVVMVSAPELSAQDLREDALPIKILLYESAPRDPSLFRLIAYTGRTPRNLADSIQNSNAPSLVSSRMSLLLRRALAPLQTRLVIACTWLVPSAIILPCVVFAPPVSSFLRDTNVISWFLPFVALLFGFALRRAFGVRYEMDDDNLRSRFGFEILATACLGLILVKFITTISAISMLYSLDCFGFGLLLANDFIVKALYYHV